MITTAIAPAFCAFFTRVGKLQSAVEVRSRSAIRPEVNPTSGWQPSVVSPVPTPSEPSSNWPATGVEVSAGPKLAVDAS